MRIIYDRYRDQVLGGWIGKSIGGTVGDRFEGYKGWIEIAALEWRPNHNCDDWLVDLSDIL